MFSKVSPHVSYLTLQFEFLLFDRHTVFLHTNRLTSIFYMLEEPLTHDMHSPMTQHSSDLWNQAMAVSAEKKTMRPYSHKAIRQDSSSVDSFFVYSIPRI